MTSITGAYDMRAAQSSIQGCFSGNNDSNNVNTNITNNFGIRVPSYVPATFEELISGTGWGVSPPEIDLDHIRDEYNLPQGETGKWIFEDVGYREWRESRESKLLWLCGGPGTGKTMLAKRVAAEFLQGPDLLDGVKLAFHFVPPEPPTDSNSAEDDRLPQLRLAKVASDLLYSILQQDGNLFGGCKAELGKQGDRFFTNSSSIWKVLRKAIRDCQTDPVYVIIDGVDGVGGRSHEELIRRILGLMEIRVVKIFLSSRDVPYVSNNLPHNPRECTKINLDTNSFVKEDVVRFIRGRVDAWGWDVEIRERAIETLLAKSDGIFLWASLAIKSLTYFNLGPDLNEFLRESPLGLKDVYRTMLHNLFSRGVSGEVLNMIRSVALALRPLTFSELGYILACMEEKAKAGKRPRHSAASSEIQPRSENGIRMSVRSSMGFLRITDATVSIVHHTAAEYLFDENREDNLPVLSRGDAHLMISRECFRYLHHAFGDPEKFPRGGITGHHDRSRGLGSGQGQQEEELREAPWEVARKDPQEAAAKWGFLRYAAESWFIHARRSIEVSKDDFCDDSTDNWLQYQFFESSDVIRKPWIKLCGDSRMEVLAGEQTPLHIAVCLGLMPLVEKALSEFSEGTNSNWSPLHLAARFISGAYKILVDRSDPSLLMAPDQDGNTPLHASVISGHLPMLRALVEIFAGDRACSNEINKKNHSGNTPLHLAFQFDHAEIVELLVKEGADPTIKNNAELTASELGAKLEREDSLDILKQDERYGGGGSWRGEASIRSQVSVTQGSSESIISQGVQQGVDIPGTPPPISPSDPHQPRPEARPLIHYDITTSKEMSRSHVDDPISLPNTTHYPNSTDHFDSNIAWTVNISMTDERSEILACLSPLEPCVRHQDIRTRRTGNVGEWLMQTNEFRSWCDGVQQGGYGPATLFCRGNPAVGKTYFTSLVVDRLYDKTQERNIAVACFYLDFAAREEQSPVNVLGSLLKQIVGGLRSIPGDIMQTFQDDKNAIGREGLRAPELVEMLQTVTSLQPTYLCVDALDQCVARHQSKILDSLRQILEKSPKTRIFLTGRQHIKSEVERHLGSRAAILSIELRYDDIVGYIRMRLSKDTALNAMDSDLEDEIIASIAEGIPETLLPVSLALDYILTETTAYSRRQRLTAMTEDLNLKDIYGAALERIREQGGEKARLGIAALMWVAYSERILQPDELLHALAVEKGSTDLNPENIPLLETLLSSCLGLVIVDRGTSAVRLIHSTLLEYLNICPNLFGPVHSIMAGTCLTYLNFRAIKDNSSTPSAPPQLTHFLNYSSLYWGAHARRDASGDVVSLALEHFSLIESHISTRLLLADLISRIDGYNGDIPINGPLIGFTGLHCASIFGIAEAATCLMDQPNCDLDEEDFLGITPLIWAAICGQEGVAKLLLEHPTVNPDKPDGHFHRTALSWAASKGHEGIVRLLLGWATTNSDVTDGWWGKTRRVLNVVRGRRYVNPNWLDKYGRTPILLAAEGGHEGVVKLLLGSEDVKSDKPDSNNQTPLHCAALSEHEGVVKILLECRDVDPNKADDYGRTPLWWAAASGYKRVVKLLLERDEITPDEPDDEGQTPLSEAVASGHEGVVKSLLDCRHVSPNKPGKSGRTPLWWAAASGYEGVVKILLELDDITPDKPDGEGQTPLSQAAVSRHEGVVKILLDRRDVSPNKPGKYGRTPLWWAAESGHERLVKMLLERDDIAPDKPDHGDRTPFSQAAASGHERVVDILLEHRDVSPNRPGDYNRTPLWWAAWNGHEGVVKTLLERDDIDPNKPDRDGRTPLWCATRNEHEGVVKILLERDDVSPHIPDNGRTPL